MTRGSDTKPVRRLMRYVRYAGKLGDSKAEEYVVEIRERLIVIRPKGARSGGPAEVSLSVGAIYEKALMARVEPLPKRKRGGR